MKVILSYFKLLALNLKEHKDNIPQVAKLAVADLKKTYTGAALGWAWAVIKPIVTIFVYWFAIEIGLRKGGNVGGVPYILWLIAGMVPWFYISETLTGGADCIRRYSYLVTKMRYPHNDYTDVYKPFKAFCKHNTYVCCDNRILAFGPQTHGIFTAASHLHIPDVYAL